MTATLTLCGLGFLLLPAPDPVRQRLGWLAVHRLTTGVSAPPTAQTGRSQLVSWLARQPWLWTIAATLAAWWFAGPVPGALVGIAVRTLWAVRRMSSAERDGDRSAAELADAVRALHDEYGAGAAVGPAFLAAAPAAGRYGAALAQAGRRALLGDDPEHALHGEPALARLGVACAMAARTGASLAHALAGVQAELAADRATRRAAQAAIAGPRSSALLLAGLPLVGVAMGWAIGARPAAVLLHSTIGLVALSVGVCLDLIGIWWTQRLTRHRLG